MWRPISWRARKTHVTRNVGAQTCVKTLTMIFANVRAVFVRAFIIKSALLETGHVSRSQVICLVSKRYSATATSLSFSTGLWATSYSVETFAILHALKWYISHSKTCNFESITFFSDSLSVLSTLSAPLPYLTPQIVR